MGHTHKQLVGRSVVLSAIIRGMTKDDCEVRSTTYQLYHLSSTLDCEIASFTVLRGCACDPKAVSTMALPRKCQLRSFVRKGEKK